MNKSKIPLPELRHGQFKSSELTILIVDDIQENLDLLEDVLGEYGYRCLMVHNGMEALEKLKSDPVHLIIADAMMPKMDGLQLCKEVKNNPAYVKIPFVIYTANYVDREEEELARSIGVDQYVVKYAGLNSLVEAVNDLCRVRYGIRSEVVGTQQSAIDDVAFLERHHAILVRKLEEKMTELEMYAETLSRKNRELQASENRYRSLFEQASIPIFIIDRNSGRVLDANRQGQALLGFSRDELLSLPAFPLVAGDVLRSHLLEPGRTASEETGIKTRSGEVLEVDISSVKFTSQDTRVMLFVRDISEEKQMRQQLLQAEKMMLMGCLAAGIAHDIRNPLAAVSINLQYLKQKNGTSAPEAEAIESSLEGTKRIEQIIENTLSFARLTPPALAPEDVNALVDRALWFTKIPAQQKNVRTRLQLSDSLPAVMVDGNQIQQVLMNLLQNAIEASPQDGEINIRTEAQSEDNNGTPKRRRVIVRVEDRGVGIPAEQLENLFKPFRTTKGGGTGLGLALSHHIIERHGGEILVDSNIGEGTKVSLLFPI